jgi:hypothetical protein
MEPYQVLLRTNTEKADIIEVLSISIAKAKALR